MSTRGVKMRLVDVDPAGLEIWSYSAPGIECGDSFIGSKMMRLADFVGGTEIYYHAHECCDATTPEVDLVDTCFLPGLAKKIIANIYEIENCESAQCVQEPLNYDGGSGTWKGSFSLRSGTIDMEMECVPSGDPDFPDFILTLTGTCNGGPFGPRVITTLFACDDPWMRNTGNINVNVCCGCTAGDTSDIEIYLVGNCKPHKVVRLIDVVDGVEIWGYGEQCAPWNTGCDVNTCEHIRCQLTVTIEDLGGCPSLAGTYAFEWNIGDNHWQIVSPGGSGGILTMTCDGDGNLVFDWECGATGHGAASGSTDDPENIDETVIMGIGDPEEPPACCVGTIRIRVSR